MTNTMDNPLIYQKIAVIMKETKAIGKNSMNQQQGFKFRGIDNVMNELHDSFSKNEVFIIPIIQEFSVEEKTTRSGGILYYTRARIMHRYTTIDGSYVETVTIGEAMDSGDKGMNKAMSIALKYSLLQMLMIPTEELKDPDMVTPEETVAPTPVAAPKAAKIVFDPLTMITPKLFVNIAAAGVNSKERGCLFKLKSYLESVFTISDEQIAIVNSQYLQSCNQ